MATLQTSPLPAEAPSPAQPVGTFPARPDKARQAPPRLVSLDAYRGFIMLVMASGGFAFASVAQRLDASVLASSTAALAGSPFPIDRHATAKALGFDAPMGNSLDSVSARLEAELALLKRENRQAPKSIGPFSLN